MYISRIILKNWKNFRSADANLREVTYVIGANAAGKSNLLDAFRFLRDVAKPQGGGLQKAISDRGGLKKIRCLHARREPEVSIEIHFKDEINAKQTKWRYKLSIKSEGVGTNRPIIAAEEVYHTRFQTEERLLKRPDRKDRHDKERLTQTFIEQVQANRNFREIAEHLSDATYLHLVPQLLKYGDFIGGRQLENDPFGQAFLDRVAAAPVIVRKSRLRRIEKALSKAIPQFEKLRFERDSKGHPHLEARYMHHRPMAGWQKEDQFSDGTLRLIALFWLLMDGDSLLLLEEPELSLDEDIVRQLPRLIDRVRRTTKRRQRQLIVSTHSQALLENKAIDGRGVLRLDRTSEGSKILGPTGDDLKLLRSGFSAAEILLPKVHPRKAEQMVLL
jgi:predicted ATPase